tara:strand:- start:514 stop:933 length:420 start_codon:yes stop_codon:yes gene_type:complete
MNVGLLLLTHNDIGSQLLLAAKSTYGSVPMRAELLSIDHYDKPGDIVNLAKEYVKVLDSGKGVIILTDMFGSTPSNIAKEFSRYKNVKIVSGINLSMLLNIFNYPNLDLNNLTNKAIEGGRDGVIEINNDERKKTINKK